MGKQSIDIETMLRWCYRDELPKKELSTSGWDGISGYGALGGISIDFDPWEEHLRSQRYPFQGKPHDDALSLDWLVNSIEEYTPIAWPAIKRGLLGDLAHYLTDKDEFVIRKLRVDTRALVKAHARMGTRPDWRVPYGFGPVLLKNQKPLVRYVDRHGKLVDCHSGSRDYLRGGQCPLVLTTGLSAEECEHIGRTHLAEIASARFEYTAWRWALIDLVTKAKAGGYFEDHAVQQPRAAEVPWFVDDERKPRVFGTTEPSNARLTTPEVVA